MDNIRVRFAPSPTGSMHVGNARTALFNWLFAKQNSGTLILRIEDTDAERSTEESAGGIMDSLKWMGIHWDEGPEKEGGLGPYYQSQRVGIYNSAAKDLLNKGLGYKCYCSPERLEEMAKTAKKEGKGQGYDGRCRNLTEDEIQQYENQGIKSVIRFKVPHKEGIKINDIIRGEVAFESELITDFVIQKSDGMATYNFAVVVDDALMKITHVIRGDDHLSNTPRQVMLYNALGYNVPEFAHVPMILGPDKARLSKRHGATSVEQYRKMGVVREAFVNYLALLGWAYDDKQQIFSVEELIEKFSLEKVSKTAAVFDPQKLEWMNGKYIREMDIGEVTNRCLPYMVAEKIISLEEAEANRDKVEKVISAVQDRLKYLSEITDQTSYFFTDDYEYNDKAVNKVLKKEGVKEILDLLIETFSNISSFSEEEVEKIFRAMAEKFELKLGKVVQPARVALTGTNVSPSLFEVAVLIGKDRCIKRLKRTRELLDKA